MCDSDLLRVVLVEHGVSLGPELFSSHLPALLNGLLRLGQLRDHSFRVPVAESRRSSSSYALSRLLITRSFILLRMIRVQSMSIGGAEGQTTRQSLLSLERSDPLAASALTALV